MSPVLSLPVTTLSSFPPSPPLSAVMSDDIFLFLALPLEVRRMVYEYALTTAYGLWIDVYRRDLPRLMEKRGIIPPPTLLRALETSIGGIISPALMRTCRQIYQESRNLIWRNQIRLDHCRLQGLNLPRLTLGAIRDLYIGDGMSCPPIIRDRTSPNSLSNVRYESKALVLQKFTWLQHLTFHFGLHDPGMLGQTTFKCIEGENFDQLMTPLNIIPFAGLRMQRDKLRSISLECPITYSSVLYPSVYGWTWVYHVGLMILSKQSQGELRRCDSILSRFVGESNMIPSGSDSKPRRYDLMVSDDTHSQEIQRLLDEIQRVFTRSHIRVYARDPKAWERGTMLVFERTHDYNGNAY
ncbi:hypothetical protein N7492_001078 [Penicillium capsulatum]|uniref:Uncharacterized protein n=1 Tax=Penicillium capsulatum TaxID=69766 RepID=A0A9W9IT49_9EURO|nr:hypothetical protein N7492_001078 [Penicillium capsulatum]KAJ6129863.1 hypothetical protein N7512_002643 [Penicillium capsulatum]